MLECPSATPAALVALSLRADIGPDERSEHRAPSPGEFPRGRYPTCATLRNLTGTSCSTSHGNLHQFFALERFTLVNLWSMPPAYGSCQIGLLCIRSARGTARKETSPSPSSRACYTEPSVYYLRSHPVFSLSPGSYLFLVSFSSIAVGHCVVCVLLDGLSARTHLC